MAFCTTGWAKRVLLDLYKEQGLILFFLKQKASGIYFYRHMGLFSLSAMCDHALNQSLQIIFCAIVIKNIMKPASTIFNEASLFHSRVRRYTQSKKFTICLQTFRKNWWQADILPWMPQMLVNHHFLMSACWGWKIKMISCSPVADV